MIVPDPGVGPASSTEESLRLSERRLRSLFDSLDEGYCLCEIIVDEAGAPVDYRFLEVNPRFERMTGLVDPVGRTALELVSDLEPIWVETYGRVALGRQPLRFEMGSGAMNRWFDVFAVPVEPHGHFAIVFKDQTDRRRAELALRESEHRFRTMADQLPLLVWQHDAAGRRDWVNERFHRYFGSSPDDTDSDHWAALHPADVERYVSEFRTAVHDRRPFHAEVRVRRADGEWRWLESWANPRIGPDGAYLGHLGTSADITDRKVAEAALRSAAVVSAFRARLVDSLRTIADPIEVQAHAARLLGVHLAATRVHYAEIDESGEFGVVHADYHPGVDSVVGGHRFDDYGPVVMNDFRAVRTIVIEDVAADPRLSAAEREATAALDIGAYVMVPLVKGGRTVAALVVHHLRPHRWTEQELTVVHDTAEHTWAAVEQARAEHSLRVRHDRAELVAELLSDLERQSTVAAQLQRLADLLVPRFADYATIEAPGRDDYLLGIAHRDPELLETLRSLRARSRLPLDHPYSVGRAAAGSAQLISVISPALRARLSVDPQTAALLDHLCPRSHMAVPLDLGDSTSGVLLVGLTDPQRSPYAREDLAFLQETAQRVGVVLAAARMRQEEHDVSVRLQKALLPDELVWHPNVVIEARYHAASLLLEVGGDWYDTFTWPDGRIGVMVGDVVGHNLDSAAAMGRLRAATAALATRTDPSPAALIEALEEFAQGPNGTEFATAACVVIDPATGRLTYASAGHPPVLVLPPGGTPVRLLDAQSAPLCALSVIRRPEGSVLLEPGSLVVMYSDGLIERRRQSIDRGIRRLEQLLLRLADHPIDVLADRLIFEMSADSPPDDDVVVACFRYAPVRSRFRRTVPARGERLAGLRAEMRTWLGQHGVRGQGQHYVLLGVGEACANAIEHAYLGTGTGEIDVELTHHGHHVTASVKDHGCWRPAVQPSGNRGRGTHIMRTLAHTFTRRSDTHGTTVTLTLPVGRHEDTSSA